MYETDPAHPTGILREMVKCVLVVFRSLAAMCVNGPDPVHPGGDPEGPGLEHPGGVHC